MSSSHLIISMVDELSVEDLRLVFDVERRAYSGLVDILGLDSEKAMRIVAFLNWLDLHGFADHDIVCRTLWLPKYSLEQLAHEASVLAFYIATGDIDEYEFISATQIILQLESFSLEFVQDNRESAAKSMNWFFDKVRPRAFD